MIENLLKYMFAKNCRNRWSFDKAIAKIKRCSFLPHIVCGQKQVCLSLMQRRRCWLAKPVIVL